MGNLHLVTGYSGTPHVASTDQGSLFEALIRGGQFVMDAGAKFAATIVSNNQIRVSDGELMMQGRHVKLTPGAYVDLAIANGSQGFLRRDLIVARYTRSSDTGIEECNLVVLKGTQAASNPSDPEYITGNLNADGALQHDFPLYRVNISGLSIGTLEALYTPQKSIFDAVLHLAGGTMSGDITMGGNKVRDLGTPTANGDAVPLKYAREQFAPSGSGLGGNSKGITSRASLDSLTINCWYLYASMDDPLVFTGGAFPYGYGRVDNYDGTRAKQTFTPVPGYRCTLERYKEGDTWSEWEWVNPPMAADVEYRTTERYQNASVYKKVDSNGNVLWRAENDSQWHLLSSASYVAAATVE